MKKIQFFVGMVMVFCAISIQMYALVCGVTGIQVNQYVVESVNVLKSFGVTGVQFVVAVISTKLIGAAMVYNAIKIRR